MSLIRFQMVNRLLISHICGLLANKWIVISAGSNPISQLTMSH